MKNIISRFTMKRHSFAFVDHISNRLIFRYRDKYGNYFLAAYPFYLWSFRDKLNFIEWK